MAGILEFVAKLLKSPSRDLFLVRLSTTLLLTRFGITGALATFLSFWIRGVLGVFLDYGILAMDLLLDSLREGMKLKEFEKVAEAEYKKVTAKVYDEKEKQAIRKQYLESVRKMAYIGEPK